MLNSDWFCTQLYFATELQVTAAQLQLFQTGHLHCMQIKKVKLLLPPFLPHSLPSCLPQGPKLTFLGRRQVATKIFFSVAKWKNVVAKKAEKKSVNKIFPSQRNTNHIFWLPDGKFWSPIFLLRIRTKRTRLPGAAMAKNHDKRIECRLYTRLLNVLSRLNTFSCLYLLEKKYTRFKKKLPVGSLLYV